MHPQQIKLLLLGFYMKNIEIFFLKRRTQNNLLFNTMQYSTYQLSIFYNNHIYKRKRMTKRLLLFVFAACMLSNTQNKAMEANIDNPLTKTVLGFLGLGVIGWTSNKIFNTPQSYKIFKKMGVSTYGIKQITFLSTTALSISYLSKGSPVVSEQFFRLAWKAPLIGLANVFINKPVVREMISAIPLIGEYLSCPFASEEKVEKARQELADGGIDENDINIKKCVDGCEHCKSIDAVRTHILWTALLPEVYTIVDSLR